MRNLLDIYNTLDTKLFVEAINFTSDLIGLLLIIFFYLILFFVYKKNKIFLYALSFAYFIRVVVIMMGYYVFPLPDSLWDSRALEYYAIANTELSFYELYYLTITDFLSAFINFLSLIYRITGRSPLALIACINFISILTILIISRCSYEVWSDKRAQLKCLIFLSIMPINILYSALIMRESLILFIMSCAILTFILYIKTGKLKYAYLSFFIFLINFLFHGPLLVGLVPMFIYLIYKSQKELILNLFNGSIKFYSFLNTIIIATLIYFISIYSFYIAKSHVLYSHFLDADFMMRLVKHASNTYQSTASFPSYLLPTNVNELFYFLPLKMVYFLLSPFPWDITRFAHIFGFIDSLFTFIILSLIIFNFKKLIHNKYFLPLFSIFFIILIVYTLGTGNFGTAIRHKFKFLFILIIFSSMFLPNIRINFNKK